jgi:hypothetical protein
MLALSRRRRGDSLSRALLAALVSAASPLSLSLLPFFALPACGGARVGLDAGGVYRDEQVAFKIGEVPAGWRAVKVDAASLAYRDDAHRASALVNGRCGRKSDDTPLAALTNHLVMGTTAREIASEETIPFDGREALHTRMSARLDGVPRAYDLYVLKKDGCVYDFAYVAEPETFEAGVPGFERFVASFHTLDGGGS